MRPVVQSTVHHIDNRLVLARIGWVALSLLVLIVFAMGQRFFYAELLVPPSQLGPGDELVYLRADEIAHLGAYGLTIREYAAFHVGLYIIFFLVHSVLATLIFWRKPHDRMACFAAIALLLWGGTFPSIPYGLWNAQPLVALLTVIGSSVGGFCFYIFLCVFPNGRFAPHWVRWVILALAVPMTFGPLASAPLFAGTALARAFLVPQWLFFTTALGVTIASQIYRYRYVSTTSERQQTRWVMFGIVSGLGWILVIFGYMSVNPAAQYAPPARMLLIALIYTGFLLVPLSMGIAIMRSQLWDIDLLLNRTLVYVMLTGAVVGLYILVVGSLSTLFQREGSLPVALLATGLIAVVFQPLRARLQRGVNRLLYGERDDPYAIVARLGQRLEGTLAPEATLPTLVETVATALKLPYAAIMLKQADVWQVAAAYGRPQEEYERFPLAYQGETIGQLLLAPRSPGEHFTEADQRLLQVLARQAGVAAHAVRLTLDLQQLTTDLQQARERLVMAREEERRRIRRDLHDGVGPVLASLVQRIDVARVLAQRDPTVLEPMLNELKGEVRATLADIRRLVYALRPPALDEFGLVAAIREQAAHYEQPDGLQIAVETPSTLPPLPAAVEVAAYRIALEALTNVARHSEAKQCRVVLSLAGMGARQALCVEIIDDGVGLPEAYRAGVGVASMRERAAELGGVCTVERGPKGGTRVCAWLPLTLEEGE